MISLDNIPGAVVTKQTPTGPIRVIAPAYVSTVKAGLDQADGSPDEYLTAQIGMPSFLVGLTTGKPFAFASDGLKNGSAVLISQRVLKSQPGMTYVVWAGDAQSAAKLAAVGADFALVDAPPAMLAEIYAGANKSPSSAPTPTMKWPLTLKKAGFLDGLHPVAVMGLGVVALVALGWGLGMAGPTAGRDGRPITKW